MRLLQFLKHGDMVIDFSCGGNEFVPMVKSMALEEGIVVEGRGYDVILSKNMDGFEMRSWFDVVPDDGRMCFSFFLSSSKKERRLIRELASG